MISERSVVGLLSGDLQSEPSPSRQEGQQGQAQNGQPLSEEGLTLEDGVIVEIGAKVEARIIGECTHVGINCRVGKGAVIGKVSSI